jgi:hypothetical protein
MLKRENGRRFRATLAARILTIVVVALASLPFSAAPASAEVDACTPSAPNALDGWETAYDALGVTMCVVPPPTLGMSPDAVVQIVDLSAGAEIQIHSERVDPYEDASSINQYNTRNAEDWYFWIRNNMAGYYPTDRLLSTTNGSFFIDTSGGPTKLSLPERTKQTYGGNAHTLGWAYAEPTDAAWDRAKRALLIRGTNGAPVSPEVSIEGFPTHYTQTDVEDTFIWNGPWLGTVGFAPLEGDSGTSQRTFVGVSPVSGATKVYILSTHVAITLSEAQYVLETFGSDIEIQLDGGGSTQAYYDVFPYYGDLGSTAGRSVPDVLAVYTAPE